MADTMNYTRLGQVDLAGDALALFKDQFIPELLTQFDTKRVARNYVRHKTITKGKSASFPILGKTGAKYYTVGDAPLLGNQTIAHNEITINLDPYLVSDILIHDLDEKMQEYDDRAEIVTEMARALANTEDKQILQVGVLAARAAAKIKDGNGGSVLKGGATVATDGAKLAAALFAANVKLDEKDVPEEDRTLFVRPLQYALLAQYINVIDRNIGAGSYALGETGKIDKTTIIKTNNLPSTNITQETGTHPNNVYYGDFTNTVALLMNKQAVATVSRAGLTTEVAWKLEHLSHLIVARVLQGHGFLRPEAAVEISSAEEATSSGSTSGDSSTTPPDSTDVSGT